jgi:hypothetical protein
MRWSNSWSGAGWVCGSVVGLDSHAGIETESAAVLPQGSYGTVDFFGGVRVVDTVHVLIFIFFAFFITFQIYMGALGHTPMAHFKAMLVTGYEEIEEEPGHGGATKNKTDR